MGQMKCPNCEVVEEDGLWMKVANSEDGESSDEDEDEDEDKQNSEVDQNNEHHVIIVYLSYLLSNYINLT